MPKQTNAERQRRYRERQKQRLIDLKRICSMAMFSHSPVLFVRDDGSSMGFHMRPCKSKDKIKPLIEYGGGILQLTAGPNVIRLVEPGHKLVNVSDDETVLSVQYIFDCVKKNRILDFKDYRVELKVYDASNINEGETQSCVAKCLTKSASEFRSKQAFQLCRNKVSSSKKEQRNCVLSRLLYRTHRERKEEQQLSSKPSEKSNISEEQLTEFDDSGDSDFDDSEDSDFVIDETLRESSSEQESTATLLFAKNSQKSHVRAVTHDDSGDIDFVIDETRRESFSEEETTATLLSAKNNQKSHVRAVTYNRNMYEASKCSQKKVSDKESRLTLKSVVKRYKESCENDFEPSVIKKTRKDVKLYDYEQCSLAFSITVNKVTSSDQITDQNTVSIPSNKLNVLQDSTGFCSNNESSSSLTLGLSQEINSQFVGSWNKCTWNSHPNNSLVSSSQSKLENVSNHDVALLNENGISVRCNNLDQDENILRAVNVKRKEVQTRDALVADEGPVLGISSKQASKQLSLTTTGPATQKLIPPVIITSKCIDSSVTKIGSRTKKIHKLTQMPNSCVEQATKLSPKQIATKFTGYTGKPPFCCKTCGYTCSRIPLFLSHRKEHEQPFKCDVCDYRCRSEVNLDHHMRCHVKAKPYQCELCEKRFARQYLLNQHSLSHNENHPFMCNTCEFSTKYEHDLVAHKRFHNGDVFRCQFPNCKFSAPKRSHLKDHQCVHTSVRSHVCAVCRKAFRRESKLQRHKLIRHSEKPFKCKYCDYSSYHDNLKQHFRQYHSEHYNSKISQNQHRQGHDPNVHSSPTKNARDESDNQLQPPPQQVPQQHLELQPAVSATVITSTEAVYDRTSSIDFTIASTEAFYDRTSSIGFTIASTEAFYDRTSSIVKKLAHTIFDKQLKVAEKDVLLKYIKHLNMLLYQQNLEDQVTDILKKQNYSVSDNAVLLKYLMLVQNKSPKEILDDAK